MRLLGLNNSYPPVGRGGYGEICADVMSGLARRGHDVTVLACGERYDPRQAAAPAAVDGVQVRRELDYVLAPWRRPAAGLRAVSHDAALVSEELERGVDAVLAWHCRGIVKTSLRLAHEAGVPVLYNLHDRWVLYERPGSLLVPWARLDRAGARLPRELAGRLLARRVELRAPRIDRDGVACFVSEWLAAEHTRRGWIPRRHAVVPCGVDPTLFAPDGRPPRPPERLLFAGRIEERKGLHVAVRALALATGSPALTVAGPLDDPAYRDRIEAESAELGVAERIEWAGEVPRAEVRRLLASHDVLLFPSIGPETFGLSALEALAAGTLVVTSAPGGPNEYLRHESNSLVHAAGDERGLAAALDRLLAEPELVERLRAGGRETAAAMSLGAVVDRVEALLAEAGAGR